MFELSANRKMSLIKILKRRGLRRKSWGTPVVISRHVLKTFSTYIFEICLSNNFEQSFEL